MTRETILQRVRDDLISQMKRRLEEKECDFLKLDTAEGVYRDNAVKNQYIIGYYTWWELEPPIEIGGEEYNHVGVSAYVGKNLSEEEQGELHWMMKDAFRGNQ